MLQIKRPTKKSYEIFQQSVNSVEGIKTNYF